MSKTIQIGDWDGKQQTITIEDNSTLQDALRIAGITAKVSQQVVAYSDASPVDFSDSLIDGETYLLTGSQVSG